MRNTLLAILSILTCSLPIRAGADQFRVNYDPIKDNADIQITRTSLLPQATAAKEATPPPVTTKSVVTDAHIESLNKLLLSLQSRTTEFRIGTKELLNTIELTDLSNRYGAVVSVMENPDIRTTFDYLVGASKFVGVGLATYAQLSNMNDDDKKKYTGLGLLLPTVSFALDLFPAANKDNRIVKAASQLQIARDAYEGYKSDERTLKDFKPLVDALDSSFDRESRNIEELQQAAHVLISKTTGTDKDTLFRNCASKYQLEFEKIDYCFQQYKSRYEFLLVISKMIPSRLETYIKWRTDDAKYTKEENAPWDSLLTDYRKWFKEKIDHHKSAIELMELWLRSTERANGALGLTTDAINAILRKDH